MITNGYVTEAAFRAAIGDTSSSQQGLIETAIQTASRRIDAICGRRFWKDASATARTFSPLTPEIVLIDDVSSTAGLVVASDTQDDGTYDQSWTLSTDYVVAPRNQLVAGLAWPITELRTVGRVTKYWPPRSARGSVRVTAVWGWPSVPDAVQTAALLVAKDLFKRPESLTGGYIGLDGWGPARLREDPAVMEMLRPFIAADLFFVA